MEFVKSLPKTKDLLASAGLMDFVLAVADNKKLPDILKNIAADKKEALDALAAANAALANAVDQEAAADAVKTEYESAKADLEKDIAAHNEAASVAESALKNEIASLDARDQALTSAEEDLKTQRAQYDADRANLDDVIAGFAKDKEDAVAAARAAQDEADAAKSRYEMKLENINNAAAQG